MEVAPRTHTYCITVEHINTQPHAQVITITKYQQVKRTAGYTIPRYVPTYTLLSTPLVMQP